MTTTGRLAQVVDAAVRAIYNTSMDDISSKTFWKSLGMTQFDPQVPEEQLTHFSGPGLATLTVEGNQFGANEIYQSYPVTLKLRKYTSELAYTKEDLHWIQKASEDRRVMKLKSLVGNALNPLVHQMNLDGSKLFHLGHGTTFFTGGNSEALFASHTLRMDASTQSNKFNTGETEEALSAASLDKAIQRMNRLKNHNGIQLLPVSNLKLIVSSEKQSEAHRVVKSEYGPNSANLGLSSTGPSLLAAQGLSIEVVVDPNIPSARKEQWVLVDANRASEMLFQAVAWGPELATETQVRKGTYTVDADAYFGPVAVAWQFGFGSLGTGATI